MVSMLYNTLNCKRNLNFFWSDYRICPPLKSIIALTLTLTLKSIINDKYDFNDPLRASYVPRLLKNQYRGISVC